MGQNEGEGEFIGAKRGKSTARIESESKSRAQRQNSGLADVSETSAPQ